MSMVIVMKKVWSMLVLFGLHGEHHCTCQKVHVRMVFLQGYEIFRGFCMFIKM